MKKMYETLFLCATLVFAFGMVIIFCFLEKTTMFSPELVIQGFQFVAISSPVIVVLAVVRWALKWPAQVTWFTLALAAAATLGGLYAVRSLLFVQGEDSLLVLKVLLPEIIVLLSSLTAWLAMKWFRTGFRH